MAAMLIVIDPLGAARTDREIDRETRRISDAIHDDAVRYAPKDSFEMVETVRREKVSDRRYRVYVGRGKVGYYWATVEYGSRAHVIRPNKKRALSWPGALHPVKKVNHPGTPQQSFMRRALFQKRPLGLAGRGA